MKAYVCNNCHKIEELKREHDSAPQGWYNVYGTKSPTEYFSAALCSPHCLFEYATHELPAAEAQPPVEPPPAPEVL